MYTPPRRDADHASDDAVSFVKRGVALIDTLDALLAESLVVVAAYPAVSSSTPAAPQRCIRRLRLRTDLAQHITLTLAGLADLASSQPNNNNAAKAAAHTAENISQRLQSVTSLVIYASPTSPQEIHYFRVAPFAGRLEELVLDECPLSLAVDLFSLRRCLFKIRVSYGGITSLSDALSPVSARHRHALPPMILSDTAICALPRNLLWTHCTALCLSHCGLSRIDEALHFFPHLTHLDLSHNAISQVVHLHDCIALQHVDLSHNKIRVLSNLDRVLGKVRRVCLSHNEIESLDGIDRIYSLEILDVRANLLADVHETLHLARLPCLESVLLAENPLCERKHYRLYVYREFLKAGSIMSGSRAFPSLDGREIRKKELKKLRRLLFRAPTDSMVESSYGSHAFADEDEDDDWGGSHDASTQDEDADEFDLPRPLSRLSLGAVSPLRADAFRRLSSTAQSLGAQSLLLNARTVSVGAAASPMKRRSSVERDRERRASSEWLRGRERERESVVSLGGAGGSAHRPSHVLRRLLAKRVAAHSLSPALSPSPSAALSPSLSLTHCAAPRRRRVAEIARDERSAASLSLAEIESDLATHPAQWRVRERDRESALTTTSQPAHTTPALSESAATTRSLSVSLSHRECVVRGGAICERERDKDRESALSPTLSLSASSSAQTSPRRDREREGEREPSAAAQKAFSFAARDLPAPPLPLSLFSHSLSVSLSPAPSMDAFIGKIHDKTEFVGFAATEREKERDRERDAPSTPPRERERDKERESFASHTHRDDRERDRESVLSRHSELSHTGGGAHNAVSQPAAAVAAATPERERERASAWSEVDPYVGDAQYRSLSVRANLELFFREQVFPSHRPSFPALYLQHSAPSHNNGKNGKNAHGEDHALRLVTPFAPEERFVTLFVEKVIDLAQLTRGVRSPTRVGSGGSAAAGSNASKKREKDEEDELALEQWRALVLSDMALYVVDVAKLSHSLRFADAPLLSVIAFHPLYKLSLCTIYFGFQRCALGFLDDPYDTDARGVEHMSACYMVLTRDKARTYPIITRVPQVANQQRNARRPRPLHNVRIENKDAQLLEALTHTLGTNADSDVTHYQMLLQTRPYRATRSLLLTQRRVLLCRENLTRLDVSLTVLDSAALTELRQVVAEEEKDGESGLFGVVLVLRKSGVLSAQRKWRVGCETLALRDKLLEECRRAMNEAAL